MPLTLRDLAPLLTPYQAPMGFDASGIVDNIRDANHQQQALDIENAKRTSTEGINARALFEQRRAAEAEAAAKVEEDRKKEELRHYLERQGALSNTDTTDPIKQRSYEATLPGMGLSVIPGRDYFSDAPATQLGPAPKALEVPHASHVGLGMPGLEMAPSPGQIDMSFSQKGGIADMQSGEILKDYDPAMARDREKEALNSQMAMRVDNASDIDLPAASLGQSMASGALLSHGYDSAAAMADITKNVVNPAAADANRNWRAETSSVNSQNRYDTGQKSAWWVRGSSEAEKTLKEGAVADSSATFKTLSNTVAEMEQNPSPMATARAMFGLARSNNPLEKRMSDQDFRASQGGQSLEGMTENQLVTWFSGDQGQARRDALIEVLKVRSQQLMSEGKASYMKMAQQRDQLPNNDARLGYQQKMSRFADFGDEFYQALLSEDTGLPSDEYAEQLPPMRVSTSSGARHRGGSKVPPLPKFEGESERRADGKYHVMRNGKSGWVSKPLEGDVVIPAQGNR